MEQCEVIDVFLQPGDYFVGDAGYRVRTLLGSCVSITLWHPASCIGAMSHFLLPGRATDQFCDARYAEDALELMISELRRGGISGADCVAKVFGGGNMFPSRRRDRPGIGNQNGQEATRLLERYGIALGAQCLFGSGHRQILFEIASGDVWSRQVEPVECAA